MEFTNVMKGAEEVNKVYMGSTLVYERSAAPPELEIVDTGLVLYYDFKDIANSSANNTAIDLSGNGNNSSLLNFAYNSTSGYTADGLRFDGVDDMIKGTNHTGLPTGNDSFTMEVVSQMPATADLNVYSTLMAIGAGPMFTPVNGYACLELNNNTNIIYFARYVGDAVHVYDDSTFPTDVRTHLTFTYDGTTNAIRWYIDGEDFGGRVLSSPLTSQTNPPFYMGLDEHEYSEGRQHIFQAARVYNRALTATEVAQNYAYDAERWGS